ncbi:hypothetical protein H8959_008284 [Pygathrix nigripes]
MLRTLAWHVCGGQGPPRARPAGVPAGVSCRALSCVETLTLWVPGEATGEDEASSSGPSFGIRPAAPDWVSVDGEGPVTRPVSPWPCRQWGGSRHPPRVTLALPYKPFFKFEGIILAIVYPLAHGALRSHMLASPRGDVRLHPTVMSGSQDSVWHGMKNNGQTERK